MMIVSFIIPVYNGEDFIGDCLDSIVAQNVDKEIIVVNDGSTDSTEEIVRSYSEVRVINQNNQGVSAARNKALIASTGDWIVFVDADDRLSSRFSDYMLSLVQSKQTDFVYSKLCYESLSESIEDTISKDGSSTSSKSAVEDFLSPTVVVGCWNKMYRRSFLIQNSLFFDESIRYGEGLKFIIECSLCANQITAGESKVYFYRKNNVNSATTVFDLEKIFEGDRALDYIESLIVTEFNSKMLEYHRLTYRLFALVRARIANKRIREEIYQDWIYYCRRKIFRVLLFKRITILRRLVLFVGCVNPNLLVPFETFRRNRIQRKVI